MFHGVTDFENSAFFGNACLLLSYVDHITVSSLPRYIGLLYYKVRLVTEAYMSESRFIQVRLMAKCGLGHHTTL